MSEITSIEPQKKDKERCNVYVDGRFYCGIKLEVAIKFHLKAGMQIEKSRLDEIQLETEKSQAMDKAFT
ncbi:MAG: recombination regulator RecX, partial [Clostridia bacterium]|nr:recombination regulator RecX [Clostridia bacterium]